MCVENNYLENLREIKKVLRIKKTVENNCVEN